MWPYRTIPYRIDPSITDIDLKNDIADAVAHWNDLTVLNFDASSTLSTADLLKTRIFTITDSPAPNNEFSCYWQASTKTLALNPSCEVGNVAHELGHVAGLHHEHKRGDSTALMERKIFNVSNSWKSQYEVISACYVTPYDLCSIMHYGRGLAANARANPAADHWFDLTDAGKQAHAACRPFLPAGAQCNNVGQRCGLSAQDIEAIADLYGGVPERP